MTEAEWLRGDDPTEMLELLGGRLSSRKQRLFAAVCCRQVWHLFTDERSRRAVEAAEDFADGRVSDRACAEACLHAMEAAHPRGPSAPWAAYWATSRNLDESLWNVVTAAAEAAARAAAGELGQSSGTTRAAAYDAARLAALRQQAELLRDLVGNPFRPVTVDDAVLNGAPRQLARAIDKERSFDHLPVLADALMDAGCYDEQLLAHCRAPGPHARGCWVVDLVLGKA